MCGVAILPSIQQNGCSGHLKSTMQRDTKVEV